jgi:hypothetical protein
MTIDIFVEYAFNADTGAFNADIVGGKDVKKVF